ncbi:MAG TPA: iron ABC transporter permease [Thermoleophilia bacterium]|nr:iron ABC transporter permease [Thermoleophilia bacterium]
MTAGPVTSEAGGGRGRSRAPARRTRWGIALAVALSLLCLVVSLGLGPASLSPAQLWHDLLAGPHAGSASSIIFWDIRMPRVLLAFIVGAALAVAGVILQDLFLNPLTDPYVTGVSSGAALGATIGIAAHLSTGLWMTFLAMATGLATLLLVWTFARRRGRIDIYVLLLAGVSASYLLSAVITLIMMRAGDDLGAIFYWLLGSFSGRDWGDVRIALLAVPFMIVPMFFTKEMNILLQGEKRALELGVDVERTKRVLVVTAAVLAAIAVSVAGIIAFVGLIIPHVVRLLVGPNHRRLLPYSLLMGAALMGVADLISRTLLAPTEIPVGVVTTFLGAPVFVYLLRRGRKT